MSQLTLAEELSKASSVNAGVVSSLSSSAPSVEAMEIQPISRPLSLETTNDHYSPLDPEVDLHGTEGVEDRDPTHRPQ